MGGSTSPGNQPGRRGWIASAVIVLVALSGVLLLGLYPVAVTDALRALGRQQPGAPAQPHAAMSYYVSPGGNGSDGASWASAWKTLSGIKWSVLQPGDTIFLDGGRSGVTYQSTLVVGKSGSASAPISIRASSEPGHDGRVSIFGGRTTPLPYCGQTGYSLQSNHVSANGIEFDNASHVLVDGGRWDGLAVYGHNGDGVLFGGGESYDTLRNVEVYDNGTARQDATGAWSTDAAGIRPRGSHLIFDQVDVHDNGQDALQSGGPLNDIDIEHSWLHFTRENPLQPPGSAFNTPCTHQDGLQIYAGGNQSGVTIRDSVLGPGLMEGVLLGDADANISSVTVSNSLVINGAHNGLIGYPTQTQNDWTITHVTVFMNSRQDALSWVGNDASVTDSIFYGGAFYLPHGVAVSTGNCLWRTSGKSEPVHGLVADPLFKTNVARFGQAPSLTAQASADFSVQPPTQCAGAGSSIASVRELIATAT